MVIEQHMGSGSSRDVARHGLGALEVFSLPKLKVIPQTVFANFFIIIRCIA